jgi:hypothetical protein
MVSIGGFDTHSAQVDAATPETGAHANLLGKLSAAIAAFQDDLKLLGNEGRVMGMTFSEFGRRIASNASYGTDHGTAAPVFIFGKSANAAIYGTNPVINAGVTPNDNLPMQFDFRSIYASLLSTWFSVPKSELDNVLLKDFAQVPVVNEGDPGELFAKRFQLEQNYPNPFNGATRIRIHSTGDYYVTLQVYNSLGQKIAVLADGILGQGDHEFSFDAGNLPSGMYFYRIQNGNSQQVKSMVLVK